MTAPRKAIAFVTAAALTAGTALAAITAAGPAGARTTPPAHCTQTAGLCDVVEYVLVRRNGTRQVWTCFLTRLPAPEGHGDAFPGYTCRQP